MLHVPQMFFEKLPESQTTTDFIYLTSSNVMTISQINCWDQVTSWKSLWKLCNDPLWRNKSGSFPLLNVAAYWKSSNTEARAKTLCQILANNIDNGGKEIGLRIYLRYYRFYKVPVERHNFKIRGMSSRLL